jgi:segregation and condensation protein A
MTLEEALLRVERLIGASMDWATIESFLPETQDPEFRKSALASSFVATLELARKGKLQLNQESAFAPLYIKAA